MEVVDSSSCSRVPTKTNEVQVRDMPRFADILSEIGQNLEESDETSHSVRVNTSGWSSWMAPGDREDGLVERRLADEYGADRVEPFPELPREPQIDLAVELAEERLQTLPLRELRALRRRLALHVHPDVAGGQGGEVDSQAMARVNTAIDAAIRAQLVVVGRPGRR